MEFQGEVLEVKLKDLEMDCGHMTSWYHVKNYSTVEH